MPGPSTVSPVDPGNCPEALRRPPVRLALLAPMLALPWATGAAPAAAQAAAGAGPAHGCDRRSVRGGSWRTRPDRQRVTFRGRDPADTQSQVFGFRVARDL